ncbi:MAG: ABC transporter permease [Propionibacteriaceae bacterium]|jgi:ABC-2 type transport system permease protein|nr:ABC transporter permease [Propionibacteriaceae bacterium]
MTSAVTLPVTSARGVVPAFRQFGLLMEWQFRRSAMMMPLLVIIQILLATTTVFGYGLLIGTPTPLAAAYLATGASTVTLIMVGLVLTPQQVSLAKTEGSLAWLRTLPVPRLVFLAADLTMYTLVALPGTVLGVLVGAWRFGITLSVSPWILFAAPLVSFIAAAVGYSSALLLPPQVAQMLSQVLVFVILLFSPISFPADRMPTWLESVHHWLPIEPLAELMRATLLSDQFTMPTRSAIVLGGWTLAAVAGAGAVLRQRT